MLIPIYIKYKFIVQLMKERKENKNKLYEKTICIIKGALINDKHKKMKERYCFISYMPGL